MSDDSDQLYLRFHGRIIDSLGIQMYQSPVAAIAELIANAWDADAKKVDVTLPTYLGSSAVLTIEDNGHGMTFKECQNFYLNIGRNRRDELGSQSIGGRPVLGRKGIGKFAGFGIADILSVKTISGETGELTEFELDIRDLRSDDFVVYEPKPVAVLQKLGPDEHRKAEKGTFITLKRLKMQNVRNPKPFARLMARRFLLASDADTFAVLINGVQLPKDAEPFPVQFEFPRDYKVHEQPESMMVQNGWGVEQLDDGNTIRWRVRFSTTPIGTQEFRGVSVFCGIKVAQTPFFFQLSGGLGGQHGEHYLTGKIVADYLDQLGGDIITTERQRINWEDEKAAPLLKWGQERIKQLLNIWKERRAVTKVDLLDLRVEPFSRRLDRLPAREKHTVRTALIKIASVDAIDDGQFAELAGAILTAWESGRLRDLITDISRIGQLEEQGLVKLLSEAQVISALHMAEIARTRIDIISGLRSRIKERDLENAIRDYVSNNPWLISPKWEFFKKEVSLNAFVVEALAESKIDTDPDWKGRMDLVLRSDTTLLVMEFMRPELVVDRDHLNRFRHYVQVLRSRIRTSTKLEIQRVSGLLVADHLSKKADVGEEIQSLKEADMLCSEWGVLLGEAESQWKEFMLAVNDRVPEDERLTATPPPSPLPPPAK